MSSTVTVARDVSTIADLREFLAEAARVGLAEDTPLHVKTKVDWKSRHGARMTHLAAEGSADVKDPR